MVLGRQKKIETINFTNNGQNSVALLAIEKEIGFFNKKKHTKKLKKFKNVA